MRAVLSLPFLLLVAALAACGPVSSDAPTGRTPPAPDGRLVHPDGVTAADLEARVHRRTNEARRRNGHGALAYRDDLAAVARRHSADMQRRRFFDHTAPDGSDATARAARDGLTCTVTVGRQRLTGFAENLAQVWLFSGWEDRTSGGRTTRTHRWLSADQIAGEVVTGWLNSPGHRRNLLAAHATREGVGVVIGPDGQVFVTQMLC